MTWLAFVGLGLAFRESLTNAAIETLRSADAAYLENYTSPLLGLDLQQLESLIGKKLVVLERNGLEGKGITKFLDSAAGRNVALATAGDPFIATTHISLRNDAKARGFDVIYIPGVSAYTTAFSLSGLQIYRAGPPATIVTPSGLYHPTSQFSKAFRNLAQGLHTLFFLDVDLPHRKFMTFSEGAELFGKAIHAKGLLASEVLGIGLSRLGSREQFGVCESVEKLSNLRNNMVPHSLIIPGYLDDIERRALIFLGAEPRLIESHEKSIRAISSKLHLEP